MLAAMESKIQNLANAPDLSQTNKEEESVNSDVLFETAYKIVSNISATGLGQFAINQVDKALWTVEKVAKWGVPVAHKSRSGEKTDATSTLVRPLPWIPFLAAIATMRVVRAGLSVVSVMIGNESIKASDIVKFVQSRRRKLRTIKYHGLRAMRMKTQDPKDRSRRGVLGIMSNMLQKVACRPGSPYKKDKKLMIKQIENIKKLVDTSDDDCHTDEVLNNSDDSSSSDDVENVEELSSSEDSGTEDKMSSEDREVERNVDANEAKDTIAENEINSHLQEKKEQDIHMELKTDDNNAMADELSIKSDQNLTVCDPTSVKNAEKLAPKIAHNGKTDNKQDPMDSGSSSSGEHSMRGSPKQNYYTKNHQTELKNQYNRNTLNNGSESNTQFHHTQPQKKYNNLGRVNNRKAN